MYIEVWSVAKSTEKSSTFVAMKWVLYSLIFSMIALAATSCGSEKEQERKGQTANQNIDSLLLANPDSVPLLIQRGELYFKEYQYDLALKDAAKAYRLEKSNPKAKLLYAEVINNRPDRTPKEVATAQTLYKEIIKKDAKNTRALIGVASTYSFQADYEKSFNFINKALRVDKHYRAAYILKGSNYLALGNRDKAISSYETAVQQDPNFYEAYFFLANIYEAEGNPQCIEYFRNAYELRPDYTEFEYRLAYAKQNFGQYEEAQKIYRNIAADTSDFYANRGYFHLGHIKQFEMNEIDSAIFYYKLALQKEPRHVESWHNLGICYDDKGDKTQALKSFGKALKYNPEFELSRNYADSIRFL